MRCLVLSFSLVIACSAATIAPTSYNMRNGDGQASGGSFNYWDKEYSGAGSKTTDAALLSGGLGNLTDGVIATQHWNTVENIAGTGPYVGWYSPNGVPVITFNFLTSHNFNLITLYLDDDEGFGIVELPASARVQIGAFDQTFTIGPQAGPAPKAIQLNLGGQAGSQINLTLNYATQWIFLSEVRFEGDAAPSGIPEPSTTALFAIGGVALLFAKLRQI